MNTLDIVMTVLLSIGLIRGLFKGFFVEVASLISLVLGIYIASNFSYYVGNYLVKYISLEEQYIKLISFVVTFILVVLAVAFLGKFITKIADVASLGLLNRIAGGLFGALKYGLLVSVVLLVLGKIEKTFPIVPKEQKDTSILYEPIKSVAPLVYAKFSELNKPKN